MRQKYKTLKTQRDINHFVESLELPVAQIKFDGIWVQAVVRNGIAELYSRTDKHKTTMRVSVPDGIYIGEYIAYTNRAMTHPFREKVIIFDCIEHEGADLTLDPYWKRMVSLNYLTEPFIRILSVPGYQWKYLLHKTNKLNEEGIVLKDIHGKYFDSIGRYKVSCQDDFFIVRFYKGEGKYSETLGAIGVSDVAGGTELMRVGGGFTDLQRDQIWKNRDSLFDCAVSIRGSFRFDSGAFRHPNFVGFKYPADEVLIGPPEMTSEGLDS